MQSADTQRIIAASLGAGMLAGSLAYTVSTFSIRPHLLRPAGPLTPELIRDWANTRGEVKYQPHPANAKLVNLVEHVSTPLVPVGNRQTTREGALVYFERVRQALRSAGRGGEDCRCAGLLIAIEGAWGHIEWNNNLGNVKAQGSIYADSPESIVTSRQVWTTNLECDGMHILRDRVFSLDAYPSYPDAATFLRRQKMLLQRRYPDVIPGYEAGDLEGLLRAERSLGGQNPEGVRYSGSFATQREATARWYWYRWSRILGSDFTR